MGSALFLSYAAGFVLATVLLHAVGIGLTAGSLLSGNTGRMALRVAGGVTALGGLVMMTA